MSEESSCWLCGRKVDAGLKGVRVYNPATKRRPLHPMSPVLDEVVPVSRGGDPLDRENVRLAHWYCNDYRGARMDVDAVRAELSGNAGAGRYRGATARKVPAKTARSQFVEPSSDW